MGNIINMLRAEKEKHHEAEKENEFPEKIAQDDVKTCQRISQPAVD